MCVSEVCVRPVPEVCVRVSELFMRAFVRCACVFLRCAYVCF